ncbi:HGL229Cp [Eremothecium sinecaudum]|uniref:HGL229Cp n=1 Tax=Eremothecium sinecaudum TaxID=45286 RepID=A0A109UY04_9SACH|nr:HGL229Cp [Eremothecium sinecaudum]AMD22111.1 HGL229Cp [Eremothecium sinecaudum]
MESLSKVQKRIAKKKQVYKPILENPYTNEGEMWPRVSDQALVVELLNNYVLRPLKHAAEMEGSQCPVEVVAGFNPVMECLVADGPDGTDAARDMLLFVCNKDGTPSVLLSQIPIAAYMARGNVTVVQLPKGTLSKFDECLVGTVHDGLLLVPVIKALDPSFVSNVKKCVQDRKLQWLDPLKYRPASTKLLATTRPLSK